MMENAAVVQGKTDAFVLCALAGDVPGIQERLKNGEILRGTFHGSLRMQLALDDLASVSYERRNVGMLTVLTAGQAVDAYHSTLDFSALHAAVDRGSVKAVQALMAHGANVNAVRKV